MKIKLPFKIGTLRIHVDAAGLKALAKAELTDLVKAAQSTVIGGAVSDIVAIAENSKEDGAAKFAEAFPKVVGLLKTYASKGGIAAAEEDLEKLATQLIEAEVARIKATGLKQLAVGLLGYFKVSLG